MPSTSIVGWFAVPVVANRIGGDVAGINIETGEIKMKSIVCGSGCCVCVCVDVINILYEHFTKHERGTSRGPSTTSKHFQFIHDV